MTESGVLKLSSPAASHRVAADEELMNTKQLSNL